jgi:flagellar biosynthesis protein FliP
MYTTISGGSGGIGSAVGGFLGGAIGMYMYSFISCSLCVIFTCAAMSNGFTNIVTIVVGLSLLCTLYDTWSSYNAMNSAASNVASASMGSIANTTNCTPNPALT